jgi:predicted dehydrogenase
MTRVGIIGLGMMGNTHLDVYAKRDDVEVVAVADINPRRLSGEEKAGGNIEGQAQGGFDLNAKGVKKYDEGKKLIRDKNIDLVDICLPTPLHMDYARRALRAGRHVLVEKPVSRTYRDAKKLAAVAEQTDRIVMCAMCMRFWPGWDWLKQAVMEQRYGKVLAATFRRVANHPGGDFYKDGDACGGALLDLHVHDTDFVQYLFGMPNAVYSRGYSRITNKVDHLVTHYEYDQVPLVVAEGGWAMSDGFGFEMTFCVNFERATAKFDVGSSTPLTLIEPGKGAQPVPLRNAMGYEMEIDYLLGCIARNEKPTVVTIADAAKAIKIAEAEVKSVATGKPVKIRP